MVAYHAALGGVSGALRGRAVLGRKLGPSGHFYGDGYALSAADAERRDALLLSRLLEVVQERDEHARATGADCEVKSDSRVPLESALLARRAARERYDRSLMFQTYWGVRARWLLHGG